MRAEFYDHLRPGEPQQRLEHPQILGEFRETDAGVRTRKRERECAFRLSPGKRRTCMREGESP